MDKYEVWKCFINTIILGEIYNAHYLNESPEKSCSKEAYLIFFSSVFPKLIASPNFLVFLPTPSNVPIKSEFWGYAE